MLVLLNGTLHDLRTAVSHMPLDASCSTSVAHVATSLSLSRPMLWQWHCSQPAPTRQKPEVDTYDRCVWHHIVPGWCSTDVRHGHGGAHQSCHIRGRRSCQDLAQQGLHGPGNAAHACTRFGREKVMRTELNGALMVVGCLPSVSSVSLKQGGGNVKYNVRQATDVELPGQALQVQIWCRTAL